MSLSAPEPLVAHHETTAFACGVEILDDWLKQRTMKNQATGASRAFVVRDGKRMLGYYAPASSAVAAEVASGCLRRNMPAPIPVVVFGRRAIDQSQATNAHTRKIIRRPTH